MAAVLNVGASIINFGTATLNATGTILKTANENKIATAVICMTGLVYFRPDLVHTAIDYVANNRYYLHQSVDKAVKFMHDNAGWVGTAIADKAKHAFNAAKEYIKPYNVFA